MYTDSMICLSSSLFYLFTLLGAFLIKFALRFSFVVIKTGFKDITERFILAFKNLILQISLIYNNYKIF